VGTYFIRNGKAHDASEAAAHLAFKYARAKSRVSTAEDFIKRVASKSSVSGKEYLIQYPDGTVVTAFEFLWKNCVNWNSKDNIYRLPALWSQGLINISALMGDRVFKFLRYHDACAGQAKRQRVVFAVLWSAAGQFCLFFWFIFCINFISKRFVLGKKSGESAATLSLTKQRCLERHNFLQEQLMNTLQGIMEQIRIGQDMAHNLNLSGRPPTQAARLGVPAENAATEAAAQTAAVATPPLEGDSQHLSFNPAQINQASLENAHRPLDPNRVAQLLGLQD
jgi:hypothetical protein